MHKQFFLFLMVVEYDFIYAGLRQTAKFFICFFLTGNLKSKKGANVSQGSIHSMWSVFDRFNDLFSIAFFVKNLDCK